MKLLPTLTCILATLAPLSAQSLQDQANGLKVQEAVKGKRLALPKLNGAKVELFSTDYETIILKNGRVRRLADDVPVQVAFKVTKGGESVISKDYKVTVPGKNTEDSHPKPQIIPEILSWEGEPGHYNLPSSLTIDKDVPFAKTFAKEIKELLDKQTVSLAQKDADIRFRLTKKKKGPQDDEAYRLIIDGQKGITIMAADEKGLYWGTRTLLQMVNQYGRKLPCGKVEDMPRYALRGFMLDVARLPIPMSYLKDVVRVMAWYKMNDLQIHLNDNYIFHEEYVDAGEDPFKKSYSAFRLESPVKGKDGTPLTAQDLSYSKKEFAEFIRFAKEHGVNIVPEFDTPGHALSFTRVRPDLIYQGPMGSKEKRRCEMLDAANPQTLRFAEQVMDEYMKPDKGKKATFDGCVVHVGADEFFGDKEDYRKYADGILKYVKSRGYTPRIWGSLYAKPGKTPVISEGVQMNIWSVDWARAWQSVEQGYDIINTLDSALYIVPEADYYRMDRNHRGVYENWKPNVMRNEVLPAGHPKLLGACFAVWNDMIDRRHNGYGSYDIRNIIINTVQTLSQKMWGKEDLPHSFDEHEQIAQRVGNIPGCDMHFRKNADKQAFELKPGSLPHQLKKGSLGPAYRLTMELEMSEAEAGKEQVLLESPAGKLYAAMEDGTIGFRRNDSIAFSYGVKLPVGKKVKLELVGHDRSTELWLDGQKVDTMILLNQHKRDQNLVSSFILPLDTLGGSFKGKIHSMKVDAQN